MARSSLRTITNINIDGQAIDAATQLQTLSFKVNCDSLSWVQIDYYDNTDGTSQSRYYPKGGTMMAKHNGEYFHGRFGYEEDPDVHSSPYSLGHDYTAVPTIFQNYPEEGHPDNTGPGKYDVLLGSGRVQQSVADSRYLYIDKDITSIRSPVRYDDSGTTRLIGGCMLEIDGVAHLIESYDPDTGYTEIATTSTPVTAAAGKPYYLMSNYLECDPFYWYCRSDPVVTITAEYIDTTVDGERVSGVRAKGDYSQAEDVAMQSYQFSYRDEQGDKTFSYTFEDIFPLPHSPSPSLPVYCDVLTQENHYVRAQAAPSAQVNTSTMTLTATEYPDPRLVSLTVGGITVTGRVFLWRSEQSCKPVLIAASDSTSIIDNTAESGKTYTYKAVCLQSGVIYTAECSFTVTSKKVKIAQLTRRDTYYHRKRFSIDSMKFFDVSSEQSEVSTVIGTQLAETQTGQPSALYSENNYDHGELTVYAEQLGSITTPLISGSERLSAIESFLTSKQPFLIADNAGNTRIVSFTSVIREHDYKAGMTAFHIGWTELCKVGEAIII